MIYLLLLWNEYACNKQYVLYTHFVRTVAWRLIFLDDSDQVGKSQILNAGTFDHPAVISR